MLKNEKNYNEKGYLIYPEMDEEILEDLLIEVMLGDWLLEEELMEELDNLW